MSVADPQTPADHTREETLAPLIAYILYLAALPSGGITILIAVILAYVKRGEAGPVVASHFNWIIRTFWLSIGWLILGAVLMLLGIPLAVFGIGFLLIGVGLCIWGLIGVWSIIRCILGLVSLSREEPYPRPDAILF